MKVKRFLKWIKLSTKNYNEKYNCFQKIIFLPWFIFYLILHYNEYCILSELSICIYDNTDFTIEKCNEITQKFLNDYY